MEMPLVLFRTVQVVEENEGRGIQCLVCWSCDLWFWVILEIAGGKFMHSHVVICLSLGCVFADGLAATDDPFVGKWKFNSAQSKVTGGLQVIQDLGGNKYKFTSGAESWSVWVNGGDQPSGYGDTVSWKETGPNTWLVMHKMNGKVTRSATLKISDDETTMTRTTNGTRPDGSSYAMDFKAKRVSGTKGFPVRGKLQR